MDSTVQSLYIHLNALPSTVAVCSIQILAYPLGMLINSRYAGYSAAGLPRSDNVDICRVVYYCRMVWQGAWLLSRLMFLAWAMTKRNTIIQYFQMSHTQRVSTVSQKMRCHKPNHKQQPIQFVCIDRACRASTRQGCLTCFPEHDGHTQNHMDVDEFFRDVYVKEKQVDGEYQQMLNAQDSKRVKEGLTRKTQTNMKTLMQKVFTFMDRHQDFLLHYIQANSRATDLGVSNFQLKTYHDELERIKGKSTALVDNNDINFLLSFLTSQDYENLIHSQQKQKDSTVGYYVTQVENILGTFEDQFTGLMGNLDQYVSTTLKPQHHSNQEMNQNFSPQAKRYLNTQPTQAPRGTQRSATPTKVLQGSNQKNKARTPPRDIKKKKKPAPSRFLISTPEITRESDIPPSYQDFLHVIQARYLQLHTLTQNYPQLQTHYPEVFSTIYDEKITDKERLQLIVQQKAHLLRILWENWIVEWLAPAIPPTQFVINVRVHDLQETYLGFLELLEKSIQLHGIVAWLVRQKLSSPKVDYHTWLILAQGNTTKGSSHLDKVYRLYHIKSAQLKDYRDTHQMDEAHENRDLKGITNFTLAKIMQDSLHQDFKINEDSKVIVKGQYDILPQTFLMAERFQVFMNLAISSVLKSKQPLTIYSLETVFDRIMINFGQFVHCLHSVVNDGDHQQDY